jgi:uncharacterized protein YcaQ
VARSHLLVLWSRLGRYDLADVDRLLWKDRDLFERITFIAPTSDLPLHEIRVRQARRGDGPWGGRIKAWVKKNARLHRHVVSRLRREGPLPLSAFEDRAIHSWTSSGWTSDRNVSQMLQFLIRLGEVAVVGRASGRRSFALARSWLPTVRPMASREAGRFAVGRALAALGLATPQELRRHYAFGQYVTAEGLAWCVREGIAVEVEVEGLKGSRVALRSALADRGDGDGRTTLLSPFDNLIIDRVRCETLFDLRYRMEIYVPKHLRRRGFWAMPILHEDRLIGTVDPRVDRERAVMEIVTFQLEPDAPRDRATRRAIEGAVEDLATFAGAREVVWPKGIASSYSRR